MTRTKIPLACVIAAAAALTSAAPSHAAPFVPHDIPVPAGKVEHNVIDEQVTANYTIEGAVPRHRRIEQWLASTRGRWVFKNADTGIVESECVQLAGQITCKEDGEVRVTPAPPSGLAVQSRTEETAYFKDGIANSWYTQDGTGTFQDTSVQIWSDTATAPGDDPENSSIEVLFDPVRELILSRTDTSNDNGRHFEQRRVLLTHEVIDKASPAGTGITAKFASRRNAFIAMARKAGAQRSRRT